MASFLFFSVSDLLRSLGRVLTRPKRAARYILGGMITVLASAAIFFAALFVFLSVPSSRGEELVELYVNRGESLSSVLRRLEAEGLISGHRALSLWARIWSLDRKIHWGRYRLEPPIAPLQIINRMVVGKGVFRRVTVPEGFTLAEIAGILGESGLAEKEKVIGAAENPEFLAQLGLREEKLEGYLFPSTYYFTPATTEREILLAMVEEFRRVFTPAMRERAKNLGLTVHEVVTLASMIEKETGSPSERAIVSGVFHNRLKRNIPLQSDPTVMYGLKRASGTLTRTDLQRPNPYNTYVISSLPPGPICNPGLAALDAALEPASVPYLYFVSKNDGTHLFSSTISEHNQAVDLYQKGQAPRGP